MLWILDDLRKYTKHEHSTQSFHYTCLSNGYSLGELLSYSSSTAVSVLEVSKFLKPPFTFLPVAVSSATSTCFTRVYICERQTVRSLFADNGLLESGRLEPGRLNFR